MKARESSRLWRHVERRDYSIAREPPPDRGSVSVTLQMLEASTECKVVRRISCQITRLNMNATDACDTFDNVRVPGISSKVIPSSDWTLLKGPCSIAPALREKTTRSELTFRGLCYQKEPFVLGGAREGIGKLVLI